MSIGQWASRTRKENFDRFVKAKPVTPLRRGDLFRDLRRMASCNAREILLHLAGPVPRAMMCHIKNLEDNTCRNAFL